MLISSISDTFISIGIWIVSGIYKIASWAFEVFLVLATGQLIDSEKYTALVNNFYLLLGIILLFFLAFSLLRGMVNPDDQKQGTSSVKKIVINLVTSAILMALLPTIFGFLYDFQTSFITKYNVIGRFFGYGSLSDTSGNYTNTTEIEQGAFQIVNGVYTAFFNVNEDECGGNISSSEDLFNCQNNIFAEESFWFVKWRNSNSFAAAIQSVNATGKFNAYNDFSKNVEDGEIDFNFFLSLIAGLFLIYIAVSFCFDMALRMVKLVFYQIIAPIPIFARVIPEGPLSKSFDQWVKATLSCYFEVYTRIFVFYFVVYLCMAMLDSDFINNQLYQFNPIIGLLGKAFLLMGMVMFMKQAPKLLSEVTGIKTDGMKLGIKDKLKEGGFFAASSFVGSYVANRLSGGNVGTALASAWRGGKDGWSNPRLTSVGSAANAGRAYRVARDAGATRRGIFMNSLRGAFGFDTTADAAVRAIDERGETVVNQTGTAINITDKDGNVISTINKGATLSVDANYIEELNAQKTRNIGAMSVANEELRVISKKSDYNKSQRTALSTAEEEADKDFNKGKFTHKVFYEDASGKMTEEDVTGARLDELSKMGVKFHESIDSTSLTMSINDVKDQMRDKRISSEATSDSSNMTKLAIDQHNTSLKRNQDGYLHESFVYNADGQKQLDEHGNSILDKGVFKRLTDSTTGKDYTIHTEEKWNIASQRYNKYETRYEETKDGYAYTQTDENGNVISSGIISHKKYLKLFDNASKGYSNVLSTEQKDVEEIKLDGLKTQNEAIDNIVKQAKEKKDAAKQAAEQRAREAEKKYHSSSNGK